ncbi:MAG: hypothetical protein ACRCZF_22745 [Gemmataceae bacterium]
MHDRIHEPTMPEVLGFFLTWSTYGTWLPGDSRGWIDYGSGWQLPDPIRQLEAQSQMTENACLLDREQRNLVEKTICEHCSIRGWTLYAVNCRTNHLHVVVLADRHPKIVQIEFKAWCTRRLKELERDRHGPTTTIRKHWWVERGSRRYINDSKSLDAAITYVVEGQELPR